MTLEEDVKKCCQEVEGVHRDAERVKRHGNDDVRKDLSSFEEKLESFTHDVREASEKLNRGAREGLQRVVDAWREGRDRLAAHLRLIEAKGFLASARRLATEGDFTAARNELAAAMQDVKEATELMPGKDAHLAALNAEIERAVAEIQAAGKAATSTIEQAVAHSARLLEELKQAS